MGGEVDHVAEDGLEEGGLSRPHITNHTDKLTLFKLQIYILECHSIPILPRQTPSKRPLNLNTRLTPSPLLPLNNSFLNLIDHQKVLHPFHLFLSIVPCSHKLWNKVHTRCYLVDHMRD